MALARREGKRASAHVEKRSAMSKKGRSWKLGTGGFANGIGAQARRPNDCSGQYVLQTVCEMSGMRTRLVPRGKQSVRHEN